MSDPNHLSYASVNAEADVLGRTGKDYMVNHMCHMITAEAQQLDAQIVHLDYIMQFSHSFDPVRTSNL